MNGITTYINTKRHGVFAVSTPAGVYLLMASLRVRTWWAR
jgi:hypothetical protein